MTDAFTAEYQRRTAKSKALYERARRVFPGGVNHNTRFFDPYPFFARRAAGAYLWDVDGNQYTDFWMGHTALILGHSPTPVAEALAQQAQHGTLYGTANEISVEYAELLCSIVPCAEMLRFCTTGAEATMYATRLARAFTRRRTVLKAQGGWHGYSQSLFRYVTPPYEELESAGVAEDELAHVHAVPFNDPPAAVEAIRAHRDDLAAFVIEPVLGAGGTLPAGREFLATLREETERVGAALIFDEVITGFRLALGGAQEFYGITPDLTTLAKILGGGLPAAAVCGRSDIMQLADATQKRAKSNYARIGGGTFSCNPMSMVAGLATVRVLQANHDRIYPRLNALGARLRAETDAALSAAGLKAETTGAGSLLITHFPRSRQERIRTAGDVAAADRRLQHAYYLGLMTRGGVFSLPGHILAISTAHTEADIDQVIATTREIAPQLAQAVPAAPASMVERAP